MGRPAGSDSVDRRPVIDLRPAVSEIPELRLDPEQEQVVGHRGSHLLVLAGPGTGKTATLSELIARRLLGCAGPRVPAERILALTFGRRAARELAHRVAVRVGGGLQPVVATFHSYAYGLVRQHADAERFGQPPRLLTAAEQDARVQELLTYSVAEGRLRWPADLSGAIGTRGIAEQVRLLMTRARSQGMDGPALAARGRAEGIAPWIAVGRFMEEYEHALGFEGWVDYSDLLVDATALVSGGDRRAQRIRAGLDLIVVDEYQDTDPAQVLLLRHLARDGAQVVAVGDPDQAIYGFRGADSQSLLDFPEHFADPITKARAPIVVLRRARRFPEPIARAAHGVLARVLLGPLPASVQQAHRAPVLRDGPGEVAVRTYLSAESQARAVADHLARAHAGLGRSHPLPWSQMAVLLRNPAIAAAPLVRALRHAGIPVGVPPDELPLAEEPAVLVLSTVLRLAVDGPDADPTGGRRLLAGPLGRMDPVLCRTVARAALRELNAVGEAGHGTSGSDGALGAVPKVVGSELALTRALVRGRPPDGLPAVVGFHRVAAAVDAARGAAERGEMVSEVLWAAWDATDWPRQLQRAALRAGQGSSAAHRDLDAVMCLFELADRLPGQVRGPAGVRGFLDTVAAQSLATDGGGRPHVRDEVRVMSTHRAKGLEWELVVVAGVQEGVWPDVRLRADLLRMRELSARGAPSPADLVAEERRLLYVACTRARSALLVTAVAEPVDGGDAPSRFLADLGVPIEPDGAVRRMPASAEGIVAQLRLAAAAPVTLLADGTADPDVEELRAAAVFRLAVLAARSGEHRSSGDPTAGGGSGSAVDVAAPLRSAHPASWWGVRPLTPGVPDLPTGSQVAGEPGSQAAVPMRLSPSAVEEILGCPLRWFLERRTRAGARPGPAPAIGSIVHELARAVVAGELPASVPAVERVLDELWAQMPFPARYQRVNERARVLRMLTAFLEWHANTGRGVLAVEAPFEFTIDGPRGPIRVGGKVDRLDRADDGSVRVVDYKTSRSVIAVAAAEEHPQLGIYQAAVQAGAFDSVAGSPGGGELVYLADLDRYGRPKLRYQPALPDAAQTWVEGLVTEADALARGPGFPARRGRRCGSCAFHALCPAQARGAGGRP